MHERFGCGSNMGEKEERGFCDCNFVFFFGGGLKLCGANRNFGERKKMACQKIIKIK